MVAPHEEPAQEQGETAEEFYPEGVMVETASPGPTTISPGPAQDKKGAPAALSTASAQDHSAAAGTRSQDPGNGGEQEAPEPEPVTEMIGGMKVTLEPNEIPTAPPPQPKGNGGQGTRKSLF